MRKPARNQDFRTFYGILFCFVLYCFISSFIAVYTIKSLHTLVIGRDSKSRQQMSAVLSIRVAKQVLSTVLVAQLK